MAAAAILVFEKRLPFVYYLTNHCQTYYEYCNFELEHIGVVKKSKYPQCKMAAANHKPAR